MKRTNITSRALLLKFVWLSLPFIAQAVFLTSDPMTMETTNMIQKLTILL